MKRMDPSDSQATPAINQPSSWSSTSEDMLCPLCDYDLRGLAEPRCPECGFVFTWEEIVDPAKRPHRYIYEHHVDRGTWSFWKTATSAFRPKRFWSLLHPSQPIHVRRIARYWLSGVAVYVAVAILVIIGSAIDEVQTMRTSRSSFAAMYPKGSQMHAMLEEKYGSFNAFLDTAYPTDYASAMLSTLTHYLIQPLYGILALHLLWSGCTVLGLMLFRWTMRASKIKLAHVIRCTAYAFDCALWAGLVLMGMLAIRVAVDQRFGIADGIIYVVDAAYVLLLCHGVFRLYRAYRHYLRFPRPLVTVAISQLICVLVVLNIHYVMATWHM